MNMDLLKRHVQPQRVLDIGAWHGESFRAFHAAWPQATIISVEANPACERFLKACGADYRMALLWSERGSIQFYRTKRNDTSSGCSVRRELTPFFSDEQLIVDQMPCTTLDLLFPDDAFDFIKLDTRGSELEILRGGLKLLRRAKFLVLEVSLVPYNEGAPLQPEVEAALDRMGFAPVVTVGEIRHTLTRELIQLDVLYASKA